MAEPGAVTFTQRVVLAAPPAEVFDFVTNAAQWGRWQPVPRAVRGAPNGPLAAGQAFTERLRAGLREIDAQWRVTQCERPSLWRIESRTRDAFTAVTFRLEPLGEGCRFERSGEFRSMGAWHLLDGNLTRWLLRRQAARALSNLHMHFL